MSPQFLPASLPDLTDRVYLVTGGNAGIGYHTVLHLAAHNAKVYLGTRSLQKGNDAIASIRKTVSSGTITPLHMDLMDFSSVIAAAKVVLRHEEKLHGLINSAGIMATPFALSADGYEAQFQTNYLSHWLLTWHLLPLLQNTAMSSPAGQVRIVNVSSMGHSAAPAGGIAFDDVNLKDAWTFRRYGQSKLANILHARALETRYGPTSSSGQEEARGEIWTAALHPGNVDTDLNRKSWGSGIGHVIRLFGGYIKPEEGAYTSLFAVASGEMRREESGGYWVPFALRKTPSKMARDGVLAERLWEWTEREMKGKGLIE